ncbi:MAG: 3-oxoacyl-ACP reductase FabG, partial [Clostridia bacterium]
KMSQNVSKIAAVFAGNDKSANITKEMIENAGGVCNIYKCDISNFEETKKLIENIKTDFTKIDILVNNAGIVKDCLVLSMNEEDFDKVINTNLKGTFNMIKHTYKLFMKQRSGAIINISSVIGLIGNAGQANYAASKSGLIGLTKSVAKELAGRGVTVNAIAPGFIESDMTSETINDAMRENLLKNIPMKKAGNGEDVANLATFLASDMAKYITGEVIKVDGGMCM